MMMMMIQCAVPTVTHFPLCIHNPLAVQKHVKAGEYPAD